MSIKELFEYMRTELPFALSIVLIVIAYFAGRLLERVIIPWLQKLAHKSRTDFDDILVKSLRQNHCVTNLLGCSSFSLFICRCISFTSTMKPRAH
jgi:hypothetical protein